MDLRDLVREDISSVASIFAFKSFGGLIGILGPGLLLDRQAGYNTEIPRYQTYTNTAIQHKVS